MHDGEFFADITFSYKQVNFLRLPLSGGSFYNEKKISAIYKYLGIWEYDINSQ